MISRWASSYIWKELADRLQMKYCVVIIDGAADYPLPERGNRTPLELAKTPNLDYLAVHGILGLTQTVPVDMESSSDNACMAILGYDPRRYHQGRAAIEAVSMGIDTKGAALFRANLVTVTENRMADYSAGHISSAEAAELIAAMNENLGRSDVRFFPGVAYRHICRIKGHNETLEADCTPAHNIWNKEIADYLPRGKGSRFLIDLMDHSREVFAEHPVNKRRLAQGLLPATMLWLFWGSADSNPMPAFRQLYGVSGALTSAVDVLKGLARMIGLDILDIPGITDRLNNDFAAQGKGALAALDRHDVVVVHIEATDEAGHEGNIDEKVASIEKADSEIISRIRRYKSEELKVLVMPDHPTPISTKMHGPDPVPFLLWGKEIIANGAKRMTEAEAQNTGFFIDNGYNIMSKFLGRS
jgi:2,3-bisphosphoglycerate-independent phosphoglycerate mutase